MQNVMNLISVAVNNENFSSVPKAKREEYSAKWKTYNVQLGEIDFE